MVRLIMRDESEADVVAKRAARQTPQQSMANLLGFALFSRQVYPDPVGRVFARSILSAALL